MYFNAAVEIRVYSKSKATGIQTGEQNLTIAFMCRRRGIIECEYLLQGPGVA